jgi:hypothetical protein
MKKFKHRKTGEIATYQDGILKSSGFCVEIGVEPSNKFWKEIIEKDYEILRTILNIFSSFTCENKDKLSDSEIITSVKRLSDGEIFSIGDNTNYGIINNIMMPINVNDVGILIDFKNFEGIYQSLNKIQKIKKQPLFITEDGIDIYEGDEIFIVNKFFNIGFSKGVKYNNHKDNKFFSSLESAQNYILENKPCLSLNEFIELSKLCKCEIFFWNDFEDMKKVKEHIKNKLNV